MTPIRVALLLAMLLALPWPALAAPLQVAVSLAPQKYFVERIGGSRVAVAVMVEPGASPHTYEPKPRRMAELSACRLYFPSGMAFEETWLPKFQAANKAMRVVRLDQDLARMAMAAHHHDDEDHDHDHHHKAKKAPSRGKAKAPDDDELLDPHTWLSPPLVRIMAMTIRDALIAADPAGEAEYHAGYAAFAREVAELDGKLGASLAGLKGRTFLVYHPAFGYFARAYGLTQVAIEQEGKEPSAKEMAAIQALAKERAITTIFVEPQFAKAQAETIAAAIGGKVAVIDPLAADWAANLLRLAEALGAAAR